MIGQFIFGLEHLRNENAQDFMPVFIDRVFVGGEILDDVPESKQRQQSDFDRRISRLRARILSFKFRITGPSKADVSLGPKTGILQKRHESSTNFFAKQRAGLQPAE